MAGGLEADGRTLRVDGLVNARDLGGLPRRDGTTTPYGVFYRSQSVDSITASGWEQVGAEGISTVVDLREPYERARDTSPRPAWLTTVESELDGLGNQEFWQHWYGGGLDSTAIYYLPLLEAMPERAAHALTAIVTAAEGGVLFHCSAGRDRTGLISLLLLTAAQVEPEAVVGDYLHTVRLGEVRAAATGTANHEPEMEELCRSHGTTTEGAFRDAMTGLDLDSLLTRAVTPAHVRAAIFTWRGTLPRVR